MHGDFSKAPGSKAMNAFRSCPYAGINRIRFNGFTLMEASAAIPGVSGNQCRPEESCLL